MNRGLYYAIGAYFVWGLLPIYWKALQHVPALEILAHRVVWACLLTLALTAGRRQLVALGAALRQPRTLLTFGASALLLSCNWFIYIWAVNAGHIIETSLGYFINPLVSVLLGVLLLKERLRPGQSAAILVALAGVIYLTIYYGAPPWIALLLAGTFALYGLLRKTGSLDSLAGLTLETLLMVPMGLAYLLWRGAAGAFPAAGLLSGALLAGAGVATAIPLLLFAAGARKLTLTTLGLLQYIAPSIQLSLGVLVYGEVLSPQRLIGFGLVWLALVLYTAEGLHHSRAARPPLATGTAA